MGEVLRVGSRARQACAWTLRKASSRQRFPNRNDVRGRASSEATGIMSTVKIRHLAGIAGTLIYAHSAGAQTLPPAETNALTPVIVTASRTEQTLSSALGDVSVIDAETLQRAGQSSLVELLQREHGIDIGTNGGPQTTTSVFLRGANSGHTVFLIDGQRVGAATAGITGIGAIDPASIERVEILRGPASNLYGADAIGGVINIITKRPAADQGLRISGSVGAGTYNTRKADVGLSGVQGPWSYSLSAGHARSGGYSAAKPNEPGGLYNPDRDGYKRNYVSGRLGLAWHAGQELELSFYRARLDGQYDGSETPFDDRTLQRLNSYTVASKNRITDWWTSRLSLGRTVDDNLSQYAPSPWDTLGRASFRTRQTLLSWQNDFKLDSNQTFSLATERRVEEVDGTTDFDPSKRSTNSVTAVYRADIAAHHVQANLRYDRVTGDYSSRTTTGLFYGYDLTRAWQITAAANTGFRLPTFNDLYYPLFGNPELRPETSVNVETGLRYRQDDTTFAVTAYRNRIDNLVQYQGKQTVNKDAVIKGLTLSASQQWGATALRASFDWMDPKDKNTGEQLTRRARKVLKLSADHRLGPWQVGGEWLASGSRTDTSFNGTTFQSETTRLGGYSLINLFAAYDINRQTQLQIRWNNVGNKDYELLRGYATPGSNVFVSLSYRP